MDKKLYTPGPINTTSSVKKAMLRDLGSRNSEFINIVSDVRNGILKLGNVSKEIGYESIIIQGSGTYAVESVLSSIITVKDKLLLIINGAYGERMSRICDIYGINHYNVVFEENEIPDYSIIEDIIINDNSFTHLAIVHCETTTGIINPIEEFSNLVKAYNLVFIVDSMSIFGAVEIDINALGIDYLISSSNKCVEGVPGFAFVIAKRDILIESKGKARTLALDLHAQWEGLEKDGQFRFTPPIQVILAFNQALKELEIQGGTKSRELKYRSNSEIILKSMKELGFKNYLSDDKQSYIINTFLYPENEKFDFKTFYTKLNERNCVIYPGKLSQADCFRIGNIGNLNTNDMYELIKQIKEVMLEMNITLQNNEV